MIRISLSYVYINSFILQMLQTKNETSVTENRKKETQFISHILYTEYSWQICLAYFLVNSQTNNKKFNYLFVPSLMIYLMLSTLARSRMIHFNSIIT